MTRRYGQTVATRAAIVRIMEETAGVGAFNALPNNEMRRSDAAPLAHCGAVILAAACAVWTGVATLVAVTTA